MTGTTYYVSPTGKSTNAGTSASSPLTLQAAANLTKPGDTVIVEAGTYTGQAGGNVLTISNSGTAGAPIKYEAQPGAIIDSSGAWNGIDVQASNIIVQGFTVEGDATKYTAAQAQAAGTGNATYNGNGIAVTDNGNAITNHVTITGNTVFNEPGGGIESSGADYVTITNNVVHDNATLSGYENSGISIAVSKNVDTAAGPHMIVQGNTSYANSNLVPDGSGHITDGEGIILDTNTGYTGGFLVSGNVVYGNGSSGIADYLSNGATITGNTVYNNDLGGVQSQANAQIFINQSSGAVVSGNTLTAPTINPPPGGVTTSGGGSSSSGGGSTSGPVPTDLTVTVPAGETIVAGAKATFSGAYISDAWGAANGGSMMLRIMDSGGGTLTVANQTVTPGGAISISGSLAQLNADLAGMTYTAGATAGTDKITVDVWNQAGVEATTSFGVTVTAPAAPPPPPPAQNTITIATTNTNPVENVSNTKITATAGNHNLFVGGTSDIVLLTGGTETVQAYQGHNTITTGAGNDTIRFAGSGSVIDAGAGTNALYDSGSNNTIVLPGAGKGMDNVFGYVLNNGDTLDFRAALKGTAWDGQAGDLGNYLTAKTNGGDVLISMRNQAGGAWSQIADLHGSAGSNWQAAITAHSVT